MPRDDKVELMRSVPIFIGLSEHELERLSSMADIVDLPKDRVILTQGQLGWEMFVMISGSAHVERDGKSFGEVGPGEVLGEIALLDGGPRTATVTLSQPSRMLVLARREFQTMLDEFPEIRLRILETVARRLRSLDRDAVN